MANQFFRPGYNSGFRYEKQNNTNMNNNNNRDYTKETDGRYPQRDDDLIIEDNTVYEIDRGCYEKLKKQKRFK
ncbi:MAG: hypothetical protein K0S47_3278 [Herbinix sp.]|nr:hypothetical protein [Herbinix sp.]